MHDIDARVLEECAKAARDAWIDSPPTVDWNSVARAVLTTVQQQGADRLAAAEKVVEAARGVVERWSRCEPFIGTFIGIGGLSVDVAEYLAAYPPTPQTDIATQGEKQ